MCSNNCATPYGEVLGVAAGNVIAYSNCNAKYVRFEPHYNNGIYTGIQWQCVEFTRRWLLSQRGVVYGDVDFASDIWNKIDFVIRVADGKLFKLQSYLNGSIHPPQVGDLLIYDKAFFNTGHVAVVTCVDLEAGLVRIAEQNFFNKKWVGNYAREIKLIKKNGRYWLWDVYLLGWKHVLSQF
jgi:glutathionylspermidine amidase/synthetase